jgi:hypothetical protein
VRPGVGGLVDENFVDGRARRLVVDVIHSSGEEAGKRLFVVVVLLGVLLEGF